jgi:hypothetical protein
MATGASLEARYREGLDETWQVGVQGRFRVSSRGRRVLGACGDLNGYGVRRELEDVRAVLELRPHRRGPRGVDNEAVADGAALYRQLPGEDRRARTRPCRRLAGDPFEPNRLRADVPVTTAGIVTRPAWSTVTSTVAVPVRTRTSSPASQSSTSMSLTYRPVTTSGSGSLSGLSGNGKGGGDPR